jgi:hypothetical protein
MGALDSLGSLVGAGASIAGNLRAGQTATAVNRAQVQIAQQQAAAQENLIRDQQAADALARQYQLAQADSSATARSASAGLLANDGSAAAIVAGQQQQAAAQQQAANMVADARIAAIGPSLLRPDGTLTSVLQSGRSFGTVANSLLD